MPAALSTPLSQALVAFTIELDNEFERRFLAAGGGARVASLVMWSNLLRFVGGGRTAGEIVSAVGLQRPRVFSALGGVERWRYVGIGTGEARRQGYGSARGIAPDSPVRLTSAGERAAAIWAALPAQIEARWRERFGAASVDELADALQVLADPDVPDYPPIVTASKGMALDLPPRRPRVDQGEPSLAALLARALIAYTIAFEQESAVSLPMAENLIRVLDEKGVLVRDLPDRGGISKEAVAMALTALGKSGLVQVEGMAVATKTVRLTAAGRDVQGAQPECHVRVHRTWRQRFGAEAIDRLRAALDDVLAGDLAAGLRPPPEGWRASAPYAARTEALLTDPLATLPRYPMVLHRGGWPDGS